jgi:Ca2+-binding EF-hand superfamily protein
MTSAIHGLSAVHAGTNSDLTEKLMSIGGIGHHGGLAQNVSALLASLTGGPNGVDSDGDFDGSAGSSSTTTAAASAPLQNTLTGSTKAAVSDQILALLTQLQQLASTLGNGQQASSTLVSVNSTANSSVAIAPSSTTADPLSNLIAAIDSNGDGAISQSELETYIQKLGGTSAEADALFAGLNQGGTGDLTKTQLASDLQQAQPIGASQHHHHHHGAPSATDVANELVSASDTSGDGSVSQSEFTSFVTGLGGTPSEATADFSALDPNNTGAVNAAQFTTAIRAFEQAGNAASVAANPASPILTLLDAFTQNPPPAGSAASVTA